jgi:Ca-dependent carbohydrate-binding module xylan-binding/Glycosyl hydrolases family 16
VAFDPSNPPASGMVLTFDDEFGSVDVANDAATAGVNWNNHLWFEPSGTTAAARLSAVNGVLNFLPGPGYGLSTVDPSVKGFSQKFGYFEARMQMPATSGTWPGFWMLATAHISGGPAAELDAVEQQGVFPSIYFNTLHLNSGGSSPPDQQNRNNQQVTSNNLETGFHTFGVLWDPNASVVSWYYDNNPKPIATASKYSTTDLSPMMLILGSGVGDFTGGYNKGPVDYTKPLKVDYIRAWQWSSQGAHAVTPQPVSSPDGGGQFPPGLIVSAPPPPPPPTGKTVTITIHASGDQYMGNPAFTVVVDGTQTVGTGQVSAIHSAGQWQNIALSATMTPGPHVISITFYNDLWDGTGILPPQGHDRNLYVSYVTVGTTTYYHNVFTDTAGPNLSDSAELSGNGTISFNVNVTTAAIEVPTLHLVAAQPSLALDLLALATDCSRSAPDGFEPAAFGDVIVDHPTDAFHYPTAPHLADYGLG